MPEAPEYEVMTKLSGRPPRIMQGSRTVGKIQSGGRVKLAEDLSDAEREQFAWLIGIYSMTELDAARKTITALRSENDQLRARLGQLETEAP